MKILEENREALYYVLDAAFKYFKIEPNAVEVVVLKGDNSQRILEVMSPKNFFLIDQWSTNAFLDYRNNNDHRGWVNNIDDYAFYFGGDLNDQDTFDTLHNGVLDRFKDVPSITIMRKSSICGADSLKNSGFKNINFAYIDASHQFESVLDDLLAYHAIIDRDFGCIQLNDCCYSDIGNKQNIGVLEAAVRFCKMTDFVPVAVVNRHWTDVLLMPSQGKLRFMVDNILMDSNIPCVEVPNSLMGNLVIQQGKQRGNISFGS